MAGSPCRGRFQWIPKPAIGRLLAFENMCYNIPDNLKENISQNLLKTKYIYIYAYYYRLGQSIWIERSNNKSIVLALPWIFAISCTGSKTAIQRQQGKQYKVLENVGRHPSLVMAL